MPEFIHVVKDYRKMTNANLKCDINAYCAFDSSAQDFADDGPWSKLSSLWTGGRPSFFGGFILVLPIDHHPVMASWLLVKRYDF
jgi:hypothetical protein